MRNTNRKNIVSAIITVLILGGAFAVSGILAGKKKSTVSKEVKVKERRTVKVSSFTTTEAANEIELDGRLSAHDRVAITSKVQGVLQPIDNNLREGRYYKKGQLLFKVDSREATYNLKAQKSSLMTSITQMMPDLKFDYPQSFASWEAYLSAFDIDQSIKAMPKPINDQEKYFVSGRNIYNQYYAIKGLETRLSEYNIYAPFSGIVTKVNVFPGALTSPGQALASMINTATYEIKAPVELDNLKYVKAGQSVNLTSTDLDKSWTGKVSRVGTIIDANTQNIPIYISVSGKGLKDGMYLKGSLKGQSLEAVTELPKDIFLSPNSIYIVQDSTLVVKEIESVKRGSKEVLIRGLSPNDKVVVGSLAGLYEGQKVNY